MDSCPPTFHLGLDDGEYSCDTTYSQDRGNFSLISSDRVIFRVWALSLVNIESDNKLSRGIKQCIALAKRKNDNPIPLAISLNQSAAVLRMFLNAALHSTPPVPSTSIKTFQAVTRMAYHFNSARVLSILKGCVPAYAKACALSGLGGQLSRGSSESQPGSVLPQTAHPSHSATRAAPKCKRRKSSLAMPKAAKPIDPFLVFTSAIFTRDYTSAAIALGAYRKSAEWGPPKSGDNATDKALGARRGTFYLDPFGMPQQYWMELPKNVTWALTRACAERADQGWRAKGERFAELMSLIEQRDQRYPWLANLEHEPASDAMSTADDADEVNTDSDAEDDSDVLSVPTGDATRSQAVGGHDTLSADNLITGYAHFMPSSNTALEQLLQTNLKHGIYAATHAGGSTTPAPLFRTSHMPGVTPTHVGPAGVVNMSNRPVPENNPTQDGYWPAESVWL